MFQSSTHSFGQWTIYRLEYPNAECSIGVAPTRGGCLTELTLAGQSLLAPFPNPGAMDQMAGARNGILFPFPNRLKHGSYKWRDQVFQFPINDRSTGNAIHGYVLFADMEVLEVRAEADEALLRLEYLDEGKHPAYPFPYRLELVYRLNLPDRLRVTVKVENQGTEPMPYGLGWHPYFSLGKTIDAYELTLPTAERVEVDDYMIPTGKRLFFNDFAAATRIEDTQFDDCFRLTGKDRSLVVLESGAAQLQYWQETGEGKYNFLQVYTPPDRQSICLEPMTCNIDAFNNEEGLTLLPPGEERQVSFGCKVIR